MAKSVRRVKKKHIELVFQLGWNSNWGETGASVIKSTKLNADAAGMDYFCLLGFANYSVNLECMTTV